MVSQICPGPLNFIHRSHSQPDWKAAVNATVGSASHFLIIFSRAAAMLKEGDQALFVYACFLFLVLKTKTTCGFSHSRCRTLEPSGWALPSAAESYSSDAHGTWTPSLQGPPVATEIEVHSLEGYRLSTPLQNPERSRHLCSPPHQAASRPNCRKGLTQPHSSGESHICSLTTPQYKAGHPCPSETPRDSRHLKVI